MNVVALIGRTTKDIECTYTPQQMAVARFTLAVDDGYGEKKRTNFISCVAFGKTAENCQLYLKKGKKAGVQGHIQTGSYEKKDGTKVFTTDVIADRVEFLEWSKEDHGDIGDATPSGFAELNEDIPF